MSADVETMMYAGEVPWHGIGKAVPADVTAEQAIKLAELDWDVETAPIVTNDQKRTAVDDYRVTRRVQDNCILGVVPKNFKPIQNRDAFGLFDRVVGTGRAIYHTAGSLQNGSKVFILAKLPGMLEVGKGIGKTDDVEKYLLLSNAHDGTRPLQMLFTPVRVVCSNTLGMALMRKEADDAETFHAIPPRVSIRQNAKAELKLKEAERIMGKALQYYEKFGDFAGCLYAKQLGGSQVVNIIDEVFPPNKRKEVTPAILGHRTAVEDLFVSGKGHDRIAGSAWALLNAFAEYADHSYGVRKALRTKDPSDRSYSILMGGAKGLKQRATKVISEAVL